MEKDYSLLIKTHNRLNSEEIKDLEIIKQDEFEKIVDALYNVPSPDYKNIPKIIMEPLKNLLEPCHVLPQTVYSLSTIRLQSFQELSHNIPQTLAYYSHAPWNVIPQTFACHSTFCCVDLADGGQEN